MSLVATDTGQSGKDSIQTSQTSSDFLQGELNGTFAYLMISKLQCQAGRILHKYPDKLQGSSVYISSLSLLGIAWDR